MQYYQLKHGFHAVLAEWQLAKLRPVFQVDRLAISPTSFSTPPHLAINWETVAKKEGGRGKGCYKPNEDFQENIQDYRYNRFVKIGMIGYLLSNSLTLCYY